MNKSDIFCGALEISPVIAAVKHEKQLEAALSSECGVLFLLSGNICTIEDTVKRVHASGKQVYLHIDLLEGFGRDRHALRYIMERVAPNGVITTKSSLVKIAGEFDIFTIQRIFLIDNQSFETGIHAMSQTRPNAAEIMPGIMPSATKRFCDMVSIPVITGGLVNAKEEIIASLNAGAVGVSTSNPSLWDL